MSKAFLILLIICCNCLGQDAATLMKKGDEAFKAKQYEEAAKLYVEGVKLDPNSADLYEKLGNAYLALHNNRSMLAFKKANELRAKQTGVATVPAALPSTKPAGNNGMVGFFVSLIYSSFSHTSEIGHWSFLPDGRYLNAIHEGGTTFADFERVCAKVPASCGTYQVAVGNLTLRPNKGDVQTMTVEPGEENGLTLDGYYAKRIYQYADGYRLPQSRYSCSAATANVSSATSYEFRSNGTFSGSSIGGISTSFGGAKSTSSNEGTYRISGNTLELNAGGKTERHFIYAMYDHLGIDGCMYKKE